MIVMMKIDDDDNDCDDEDWWWWQKFYLFDVAPAVFARVLSLLTFENIWSLHV